MMLISALGQALEIKSNTPGVLPFRIGIARTINRKHIFLYYVNLTIFGDAMQRLYNGWNSSSFLANEKFSFSHNLMDIYHRLQTLTLEILQEFNYVQLITKRSKRGLFNAGGYVRDTFVKFVMKNKKKNCSENILFAQFSAFS